MTLNLNYTSWNKPIFFCALPLIVGLIFSIPFKGQGLVYGAVGTFAVEIIGYGWKHS